MSRINTNINSIIAQRILTNQNDRLFTTLERLSTGLRINSAKDDPAGLIASETLRAEKAAIEAATYNVGRARNVVAVAESGMGEIARLLNDIEDLIDTSANESGISEDERDANQQEIDSILASIDRIAQSVELQGKRLLGGELAYETSTVSADNIAHLQLNSVRLPESGAMSVNMSVTQAASLAALSYAGASLGATPVTIVIEGNTGSERITLASASVDEVKTAINQVTPLTGVVASGTSTAVMLYSEEYGSDQFVRVRVIDGTWDGLGVGDKKEDNGVDARVMVNGQSFTADGLNLGIRTTTIDADITLHEDFGKVTSGGTTKFGVTGGGATFMIEPQITVRGQASLGIAPVLTTTLGNRNTGLLYTLATGGQNSLDSGNYGAAQRILRTAISQVATMRGRLGSFERNILDTAKNSLEVQNENITAAESTIRDADFAVETTNLTKRQILVQSAGMVLRIATQQPQQVLSLLGG